MTTCLVLASQSADAASLRTDLESVGFHVIGAVQRGNLVQEAIRGAPDLVVCLEASPDEGWFEAVSLLMAARPTALLLFSADPDVSRLERALESGVSAYVVDGYDVRRLRSLVHLALARFAHERRLREALDDVTSRFGERKLVDRAKGILMRARQVSEDEAFQVLRLASMHTNQRVGQVSQQVIFAATYAEAVNTAGQLRMLSQRLVKLYALCVTGLARTPYAPALEESVQRIEANLATLAKNLSKPTYGDLLEAVSLAWTHLKASAAGALDAARLPEIDRFAEEVLQCADRLVNTLEASGLATPLQVINLSGRQRMLSQRLAKQALLGVLVAGPAGQAARAAVRVTRAAFEEALARLEAAPLSSREIRDLLDAAQAAWAAMVQALEHVESAAGQRAIGEASETLLELFEQATERYERSMQMLMG
jgi:AmiR/NasT family two-component response regulator